MIPSLLQEALEKMQPKEEGMMFTKKQLLNNQNSSSQIATCLACSKQMQATKQGEHSPTNMAKIISPNAPSDWLPWKKTFFKDQAKRNPLVEFCVIRFDIVRSRIPEGFTEEERGSDDAITEQRPRRG